MDKNKTIENVIKAIINWNQQKLEFDKKFLELQDNFDLVIEEDENIVILKTKFKK